MMSTSLRPRRWPNFTTPVAVANRVSSLPLPTFSPGWNRVPRWRTMIVPACTSVPLKTFTPSRCAFESRPLRDEAAPFFFDMAQLLLLSARRRDVEDLDDREVLTVAVAAPVVALGLVDESVDLGPAGGTDDPGLHHRAVELRRRGLHGLAVDHEDGRELDLAAVVEPESLDL